MLQIQTFLSGVNIVLKFQKRLIITKTIAKQPQLTTIAFTAITNRNRILFILNKINIIYFMAKI
jgi:hypothetical protein